MLCWDGVTQWHAAVSCFLRIARSSRGQYRKNAPASQCAAGQSRRARADLANGITTRARKSLTQWLFQMRSTPPTPTLPHQRLSKKDGLTAVSSHVDRGIRFPTSSAFVPRYQSKSKRGSGTAETGQLARARIISQHMTRVASALCSQTSGPSERDPFASTTINVPLTIEAVVYTDGSRPPFAGVRDCRYHVAPKPVS